MHLKYKVKEPECGVQICKKPEYGVQICTSERGDCWCFTLELKVPKAAEGCHDSISVREKATSRAG